MRSPLLENIMLQLIWIICVGMFFVLKEGEEDYFLASGYFVFLYWCFWLVKINEINNEKRSSTNENIDNKI